MELGSACVRATFPGTERSAGASMAFSYHGPTAETELFASGELRRQVGLKLRARDTCNVIYVMWHIEPTSGIFVSIKHNPALHEHGECRDHGYIHLRSMHAPLSAVRVGEQHALEARIAARELQVLADGVMVWRGELPAAAFELEGPIGLRSDNGLFMVRLSALE
jgi:hypothetical protein